MEVKQGLSGSLDRNWPEVAPVFLMLRQAGEYSIPCAEVAAYGSYNQLSAVQPGQPHAQSNLAQGVLRAAPRKRGSLNLVSK